MTGKRNFAKRIIAVMTLFVFVSVSGSSYLLTDAETITAVDEQPEADVQGEEMAAETEQDEAELTETQQEPDLDAAGEISLNYLYYNEEFFEEEGRLVVASLDTGGAEIESAKLVYVDESGGQELASYMCVDNLAGFYLKDESVSQDDILKVAVVVAGESKVSDIQEVAEAAETEEIELEAEEAEELLEEIYKEETEELEALIATDEEELEAVLENAENYVQEQEEADQAGDVSAAGGSDVSALTGEATVEALPVSAVNASGNVIVVLDPGHGGSDPGTSGKYNGKTYTEAAQVLKIAKAARDELNTYNGVSVYMTRETDKYMSLTERVNYAKGKNATVLVSLHLDSSTGSTSGAHIILSKGTYRSDLAKVSTNIAAAILKELNAAGFSTRSSGGYTYRMSGDGTKYSNGALADYYGIIRQSTEAGFASMIIEHAFMSSSSDMKKLSSDSELKKIGIADATGIAKYYGLSKTAEYFTTNPGQVKLLSSANIYNSVTFKNSTKTGKKLAKGATAKVTGIAYTNAGTPRLKVSGGYITANKKYVSQYNLSDEYYTSNPGTVKLLSSCNIYSSTSFKSSTKTGKNWQRERQPR